MKNMKYCLHLLVVVVIFIFNSAFFWFWVWFFLNIPIFIFFNLSFIVVNEKYIHYLSRSRFNWLKCGSTSVLCGWHHIPHEYSTFYLELAWKLGAENEKMQGKILYKECNPALVNRADSLLRINNNENN